MLVRCVGENGRPVDYVVPRRARRRQCPDVEVLVPLATLRTIFESASPLERIDAVGSLSSIHRLQLFAAQCPCDADHSKAAANMLRCFQFLSAKARAQGALAELNIVQWIQLAAVQGDTPAETERLQLLELPRLVFGGVAPSADSADLAPDEQTGRFRPAA